MSLGKQLFYFHISFLLNHPRWAYSSSHSIWGSLSCSGYMFSSFLLEGRTLFSNPILSLLKKLIFRLAMLPAVVKPESLRLFHFKIKLCQSALLSLIIVLLTETGQGAVTTGVFALWGLQTSLEETWMNPCMEVESTLWELLSRKTFRTVWKEWMGTYLRKAEEKVSEVWCTECAKVSKTMKRWFSLTLLTRTRKRECSFAHTWIIFSVSIINSHRRKKS